MKQGQKKVAFAEKVNFCGASGASYGFTRMRTEDDWARVAGVVLFAAEDGASWRVIRIGDQGGVDGDIGAFWRWREARRYGATAIFVRPDADFARRRREVSDLVAGLDPVFTPSSEAAAEAAMERIAA
ncbi:MAG: hypothetical protein R3C52_07355 [Hyphomonadaceae bacterium]